MKPFLKKILYFSILVIIFLSIIESLARNQPNSYAIKREYAEKHKDSIKCLILGSSHTLYGLNPEYMSIKTVNMANNSHTLTIDAAVCMRYAEMMPQIKYIIMPISPLSFYYSGENEAWIFNASNIYYGINIRPFDLKYHFAIFELSTIQEQAEDIGSTESGFGTRCSFENRPDNWRNHKIVLKRHTIKELRGEVYDENVAAVKEIARYCKKRDIKLILITTPFIKEYRDNTNKEQLSDMHSTINSIRKEYSDIVYHDFMTDIDFIDEDFYDSDHLSDRGAKKLTIKIDSILKSF